jgi:hypothetical protein
MVNTFARVPFAAVHLPQFSGWWVVGFYGATVCVVILIKKFKKQI